MTDSKKLEEFFMAVISDLEKELYSNSLIRGRHKRRIAAEELGKKVQEGNVDAVKILANASIHSKDRNVLSIASRSLMNLENQDQINIFCEVWADSRNPDLEKILMGNVYAANTPMDLKVITRLKKGEINAIKRMGIEVIEIVINALNDIDNDISSCAVDFLGDLEDQESIEILCGYLLGNENKKIRTICINKEYQPQNEDKKALFYFITEQFDKFEILDFQEEYPLLIKAYNNAQSKCKEKFIEVARKNGKADILRKVMVDKNTKHEVSDIGNHEWQNLVGSLEDAGMWDELWKLVFITPPSWSAKILRLLNPEFLSHEQELFNELFNYVHGKSVNPIHCKEIYTLEGNSGELKDVMLTPDGKKIVGPSKDKLRVWDLETGQTLQVLEGHNETVNNVVVTPDGKKAISASADATLRIWDLKTGQTLQVLEGHNGIVNDVVVTPDGKKAISASADATLRVWDLETGQTLQVLENKLRYGIYAVVVTPDEKKAVTVDHDKLRIWDLKTGQTLNNIGEYKEGKIHLVISPDGEKIISDIDRALNVIDLETGTTLYQLNSAQKCVIDYKRAIHQRALYPIDDALHIFDLETGETLQVLEGHTDYVWAVTITPDKKKAVSAGSDGNLCVWDLETGQAIQILKGHEYDGSRGMIVTPDCKKIVCGSDNGILRVWSMVWDKQIAFTNHEDLEFVQEKLKDNNLPSDEIEKWKFVETLIKAKLRYDIGIEDATINLTDFDIEIE